MRTLAELAGSSFVLIDADEAAADALDGREFGILTRGGTPICLADLDELAAGRRPPLVLVSGGLTLEEFRNGPGVTLLNLPLAGIVVVDDVESILGVVPIDTVLDFLYASGFGLSPKVMGLHGPSPDRFGQPSTGLARVTCLTCGNVVSGIREFDPDDPPLCRESGTEHPLRVEE